MYCLQVIYQVSRWDSDIKERPFKFVYDLQVYEKKKKHCFYYTHDVTTQHSKSY